MILTLFNFMLSEKMVITKEPMVKFSPTWLTQQQQREPKCCTAMNKNYSLDLQLATTATKDIKDTKVCVMYVALVLNGNYMLCVQRRTVDFRKSTFQVVVTPTKNIQHEINKHQNEKGDFTVPLHDCEKVFDVNFTEVYQVELHSADVLTIVGMKNTDNYIVRQYKVKASKHDIFLKNEFSLSLTTKQLIVKGKKSTDVFKNLKVPDISQFVMTSLYCENHVTCFVYSISTYNCENRWLVCVYDSKAARTEEKFKYIEIRENLIRGRITGISLLNNQTRIMLVTNTFQLLTYEIEKKKLVLKYIRLLNDKPLLFESEQEFIYTQKITTSSSRPHNKDGSGSGGHHEVILACSKSGKLYSIPDSYNPAYTSIHSVDIATCLQDDEMKLDIEQFLVCNYTKQCFLLCRNGMIYTYDLQHHRVTQTFGIHNNNTCEFMDLPTFYYNLISVNYYGDELFYLKGNTVDVYLSQETECPSLKDLCRKTLLQSFPKRYVKNSKMPSKIKRYVLDGI